MKRYNFRISTSLTLVFTGIFSLITGIILILYGKGLTLLGIKLHILSDEFLGLVYEEWRWEHIVSSLFFSGFVIIHFYYNYKTYRKYFQNIKPLSETANKKKIISTIILILMIFTFLTGILPLLGVIPDLSFLGIEVGGTGKGKRFSESAESTTKLSIFTGRGFIFSIHTILAIIFFILLIFHNVYNWKSLKFYITSKIKKKKTIKTENVSKRKMSIKDKNGSTDVPIDNPRLTSRNIKLEHDEKRDDKNNEKNLKKNNSKIERKDSIKKREKIKWPMFYREQITALIITIITYFLAFLFV